MIRRYDTVDGRNPAPVSRYCTLSHYLQGFCTSQLVQDFFHQQYLFITESWNNIFVSAFFGRYAKLIESNFYQLQIDFRWFSWNINLWSVCVPFICWLCIQCIYTYIYIYTHVFMYIYIYMYVYIYISQNSATYSFKDVSDLMPAYWGAHVFFCGNFPKHFDHWHFSPQLFDPKKDTSKIPRGVEKLVSWDSCPLCWPSLRAMASLSWRKSLRFIRPPLHWSWEWWCALDSLGSFSQRWSW